MVTQSLLFKDWFAWHEHNAYNAAFAAPATDLAAIFHLVDPTSPCPHHSIQFPYNDAPRAGAYYPRPATRTCRHLTALGLFRPLFIVSGVWLRVYAHAYTFPRAFMPHRLTATPPIRPTHA